MWLRLVVAFLPVEVVSYMKEITESQGLNAKYQIDGDEVVIRT